MSFQQFSLKKSKGYPSSFTGKFGFIRYKIEAVIHKDWDSFRKEIIFAVIAPYNGFSLEIFVMKYRLLM